MKVILREDIRKLGEAGDVVDVSHGYARNYLIPNGLAEISTPDRVAMIETAKIKKKEQLQKMSAEIKMLAEKLQNTSCTITVKAGEDDKLFGAVTNADIAKKLFEEGIPVEKKNIILEEPIKRLGIYNIEVKLAPEETAVFKLWIVKE